LIEDDRPEAQYVETGDQRRHLPVHGGIVVLHRLAE